MSSTDAGKAEAQDSTIEASTSTTTSQISAYTIGSVSSDPTWKEQGQGLLDQGTQELQTAQQQAKSEAVYESLGGKLQSAYGFITGDQKTASDGNKKAEAAEWKAALADGHVPQVSLERAKGKVESAIGMVTGDIEKQQQGNMRAEKAAWTGK